MSLESDIALLKYVPLLSELTDDQLRLLAFGAEHKRLVEGDALFHASQRADAGYVVAEGQIALLKGRSDDEQPFAVCGPGTLIGELALLTETRRPVTAMAATDCDVIRIARPLFRRMLEEYPEIAASLHARISAELSAMTEQILALEDRFGD